MNTVFIVLGVVLVVLFLAWIFLVRPGTGQKWLALVLDAALIVVSVAVFATGFLLRNQQIAANVPQEEEGGRLDGLDGPENGEGGNVLQLDGEDAAGQEGGCGKPEEKEASLESSQAAQDGEAPEGDQNGSESGNGGESQDAEGDQNGNEAQDADGKSDASVAPNPEGGQESAEPEDSQGAQDGVDPDAGQEGQGSQEPEGNEEAPGAEEESSEEYIE